MRINDVDLIFDATDADTLDKYLTAVNDCAKANAKLEPPGDDQKKIVKMYKDTCGTVKKVFDDIFGEGTGEAVCGKGSSLKVCSEAYMTLMKEYDRQQEEQTDRNNVLQAYMKKNAAN